MEKVALIIGYLVLIAAFLCIVFGILCFVGFLICLAWESFSYRFRAVLQAEKYILLYKKYQKDFHRWLEGRNDGNKKMW